MQRRRELFSRQKVIKDLNNEDSGLSSRDLPSMESDQCTKSVPHDEDISERIREMCIHRFEKPPHPMPQTLTPTQNRRPTFSLPRIFAQKKKVASSVPHLPSATATTVTSSADEQPQLSPGTTTTTTTSAYNTGVDTGQESPPANTKKQSVNTVERTMMDGRNTVGAGTTTSTITTATTTTAVRHHPSMLPTFPRAKQTSRKQHVRFESDSVSCLPQALFYTSAERLAETIATQQRLLHQELSVSSELPTAHQQKHKDCLLIGNRQQNQQQKISGKAYKNTGFAINPQQQQQNLKVIAPTIPPNQQMLLQYPRIQSTQKQPQPQQPYIQYTNASSFKLQQQVQQQHAQQSYQQLIQQYSNDSFRQRDNAQGLQYPIDTRIRHQSNNTSAKEQQVQHVQARQQLQYSNDNIYQMGNPLQQVLQYPKDSTLRYFPKNDTPAKQKETAAQNKTSKNCQTGSLRRQQQQEGQFPIQYSTSANEQQQKQQQNEKIYLPAGPKQFQLQYSAGTSGHSTQQKRTIQYQSLAADKNNKITVLHRAEKRMTAEDVLLVDQKLRQPQPHDQAAATKVFLSPSSTSAGLSNRWDCCPNLAQNLPRPDWPRGTELAELFAFNPSAQQQHQQRQKQCQQQREKRRGSPSKQISGQHRQQPELEWVIKRRSDGSRYVTRRQTRKRATPSILAAVKARREQSLARERAGMSTTDDDGGSEAVANAGVVPKWWSQRTISSNSRRKPPPIPSAFSPFSFARKKPPAGGAEIVGNVVQSDPQKAFTITTV